MPEIKLPRLLAAAEEFNIDQKHLIDFLVAKGFSRNELRPTTKLTIGMYNELKKEFQEKKRG